ncbi:MAG: xanthine dehydrogenase family protein molybdopterin-binding subunit [Dehalococcoidia bacterium]|nr:xanthine dehydrogenase family protein molybdopterin-binding subunit [Dehalococcoidia bacterium]
MDTIGQSVPRIDALDKVTGRAAYVGDLEVPGMLHGKILRSPLPHAVVKEIDVRKALKLPGVVAVLTRDDLEGLDPFYGAVVRDRPFIATDKVRYQGEPVAAVAAVDLSTAEEALDLIQVKYDELPVISDTVGALMDGEATVHETNLCNQSGYEWGDVTDAFAKADHVFEDTFTFPMVYHYSMEPHAVIADYSNQGITVWSTAQHPFLVREDLARMFGFQLHQVRVVVPYLGGGFGSKSYTKLEPLVVALSKVAGRPVRVALTVEEAFKTIRRHAARCTVKTGVMNDGSFVAREGLIHLDTGAYADNGPLVANRAAERIMGAYRWDNVKITSNAVYTNSTPAGSFRSIGAPQAAWASESQVDIIADALGLGPLEIRLKNLVEKGEEFRPGRRALDADPATGLRMAAEAIGMGLDKELEDQGSALPIKTGRGLGCNLSGVGSSATSTAIVRLHVDGTVTVFAGTTEIGQGSRGVLAQIASQELQVPFKHISMVSSDTGVVPYDRSTGSSRSTTMMGLAVQGAAKEVKDQLIELAALHFDCPPEELSAKDGLVIRADESVAYGTLIEEEFGARAGELLGRGYVTPRRDNGRLRQSPAFWEIGIAAAEIEVDTETGVIRIPHYVSVADVGVAINPQQCEGQDEGASMQGLGHTLFEEMVYEDGQLLNPNLVDYKVPTFADLPANLETQMIENHDGPGPFGAKGLGEGGIVSAAPSVANALFQATGVRIKDLPLTPERVWRELRYAAAK